MTAALKPLIAIITGSSPITEMEFHACLPDAVRIATTRIPLKKVSYNALEDLLREYPAAASVITASRPSVITLPNMTGSCLKGEAMVNSLEQQCGIPVLVPSLEIVRLLHRLGATKIALVSLFGVELNLLEMFFFKKNGIEIPKIISLNANEAGDPHFIDHVDNDFMLQRIEETDLAGIQAVVFDSPTYELLPIMDRLVDCLRRPFLSVNQVLMYAALERLALSTDCLFIDRFLS